MMQICQDNHKAMLNDEIDRDAGMEWNAEDMLKHQNQMLNILFGNE